MNAAAFAGGVASSSSSHLFGSGSTAAGTTASGSGRLPSFRSGLGPRSPGDRSPGGPSSSRSKRADSPGRGAEDTLSWALPSLLDATAAEGASGERRRRRKGSSHRRKKREDVLPQAPPRPKASPPPLHGRRLTGVPPNFAPSGSRNGSATRGVRAAPRGGVEKARGFGTGGGGVAGGVRKDASEYFPKKGILKKESFGSVAGAGASANGGGTTGKEVKFLLYKAQKRKAKLSAAGSDRDGPATRLLSLFSGGSARSWGLPRLGSGVIVWPGQGSSQGGTSVAGSSVSLSPYPPSDPDEVSIAQRRHRHHRRLAADDAGSRKKRRPTEPASASDPPAASPTNSWLPTPNSRRAVNASRQGINPFRGSRRREGARGVYDADCDSLSSRGSDEEGSGDGDSSDASCCDSCCGCCCPSRTADLKVDEKDTMPPVGPSGVATCLYIFLCILTLSLSAFFFATELKVVAARRRLLPLIRDYVPVSCEPNASNNGYLVHIDCPLKNLHTFYPPTEFSWNVDYFVGVFFEMRVEMYQWTMRNFGFHVKIGGRWSETLVDSSSLPFSLLDSSRHVNPDFFPHFPGSGRHFATDIFAGDFRLPSKHLVDFRGKRQLPVKEDGYYQQPEERPPTYVDYSNTQAYGNALYTGDPLNPKVGDLKITFWGNSASHVSALAMQTYDSDSFAMRDFTLKPYPNAQDGNRTSEYFHEGDMSPQQLFESAVAEQEVQPWQAWVSRATAVSFLFLFFFYSHRICDSRRRHDLTFVLMGAFCLALAAVGSTCTALWMTCSVFVGVSLTLFASLFLVAGIVCWSRPSKSLGGASGLPPSEQQVPLTGSYGSYPMRHGVMPPGGGVEAELMPLDHDHEFRGSNERSSGARFYQPV